MTSPCTLTPESGWLSILDLILSQTVQRSSTVSCSDGCVEDNCVWWSFRRVGSGPVESRSVESRLFGWREDRRSIESRCKWIVAQCQGLSHGVLYLTLCTIGTPMHMLWRKALRPDDRLVGHCLRWITHSTECKRRPPLPRKYETAAQSLG